MPDTSTCSRGIRRNWRGRLVVAVAVPVVTLAAGIGCFFGAVVWSPYPSEVDRPPESSTWIQDRNGVPLAAMVSRSGQWHRPLTESEISPHLFEAIVSVEDGRFWQHGGVDWQAAASACVQNLSSLGIRRGASTITMQLYRLRDPAPRTLASKLIQSVRACQIERTTSKREILVEYLNRAPFGGNLSGAGAASWRYFGRSCAELSLGQAALLAGLPQSPNRFAPDRHPERAAARRDHVLDRMVKRGVISQAQRDEAAREPVVARLQPLPQNAENGLLPTLCELASRRPSQVLRTTFDARVQKQAAALAREGLSGLSASHVSAVAVTVLDTASAECLAAVSLTTEKGAAAQKVDLTSRPRSSGSTLKPFIYAAAFDAGICSPGSVLDDSPATWAGYTPENYDHGFRGAITASEALRQSRNIPALAMLSKVGVDRAVEVMGAAGFTTLSRRPQRYGLTLAIGGADVTPTELAEAYATLARGGRFHASRRICQDDTEAKVINALPKGNVLRPEPCRQVLAALAYSERTRQVWPPAVGLRPAWKTGTSSGHRDAWCAVVTARRTVVVWLGNADGAGSDCLVGHDAAAPLALKILTAVDSSAERSPNTDDLPEASTVAASADLPSPSVEPASLVLLSPRDGQEVIRDPAIAAGLQRLSLSARTVGSTRPTKLWWYVDGTFLATAEPGVSLWWSPEPGRHEIRSTDADGHSVRAVVRVR